MLWGFVYIISIIGAFSSLSVILYVTLEPQRVNWPFAIIHLFTLIPFNSSYVAIHSLQIPPLPYTMGYLYSPVKTVDRNGGQDLARVTICH